MAIVDLGDFTNRFEGAALAETLFGPSIEVPSEHFQNFCAQLKEMGCELSSITAVDRVESVEVVAHILETPASQITVKTSLPNDNLVVDSLVPVWAGAEWQEREVYDLFGVTFRGNPDMTRVFLTDDFKGHPLRKSFELEEVEW